MRRAAAAMLVALVALCASQARAQGINPHLMTTPDGELNMDVCNLCHNEDLSLQRSKLETCTLCHGQTAHSGSLEHLRADPAQVASALAGRPKGAPDMPLTEGGQIYCGTCHLIHDPKLSSESPLREGWTPPDGGLAAAVCEGIAKRWARLAAAHGQEGLGAKFVTRGTRRLRAAYADGALCLQCHGTLR